MPVIGIAALAVGGGLIALAALSPYRMAIGFKMGIPFPLVIRKVGVQQNGDDAFLERDSADAFERMQQAALMDGVSLYISTAFRTYGHQALLYLQNKPWLPGGTPTAIPGWSNHQEGLALDIDVGGANWKTNRTWLWLRAHAAEYGFRDTVYYPGHPKYEAWHWSRGNG